MIDDFRARDKQLEALIKEDEKIGALEGFWSQLQRMNHCDHFAKDRTVNGHTVKAHTVLEEYIVTFLKKLVAGEKPTPENTKIPKPALEAIEKVATTRDIIRGGLLANVEPDGSRVPIPNSGKEKAATYLKLKFGEIVEAGEIAKDRFTVQPTTTGISQ